jgi:DNA-binding GntR family transcriptional regulator
MNNTLDLIAGLVDSDDHNSTSCQIARALKGAIDRGKILPGTRLPSARALAERLGVSRSTAHRSFQTLMSQGYIKSAIGKASQVQKPFLKSCMSTVVAEDDSIDCSPSIAAVENPAAGVDHFD